MHLSLIPLLPFTIAFVAGILLQGTGMSAAFILFPLLLALTAVVFRRNTLSILSLGVALGFGISTLATPPSLPLILQNTSFNYSGVATEVRYHDPTQIIIVNIDSCEGRAVRPFSVKIVVPSFIPTVLERDRISFSATLNTLDHVPDLPDETDFNASLRLNGCVGQSFVAPDSIHVLGPEPGLLNLIRRQREKITLLIASSPLSDSTQEFLNAVLTGDRSMLTPETKNIFSATGLSHILALSGLHVGILTIIFSLILLPLSLTGLRHIRTAILLLILWGFAIMTGLTPSVVRAVIMASVFMVSVSLQRVHSPINSLCFAALMILIFSPHSIYTIGFQLSFFAVATIIIFAEKLNPFSRRQSVAYTLSAYPAVTLAAILGTGIVSACYFHIFPFYSIPANFISALLLPFIIGGSLLLLTVISFGFRAEWLADCIDYLYNFIISCSSGIGHMPGAIADKLLISPLSIFAWFLTLTALALWLYKRRPVYVTATLLFLTFTFFTILTDNSRPIQGTEIYIPRTSGQTSLLIRHNNSLFIGSTAYKQDINDIVTNFEQRYALFMMKRDIDSIGILPANYNSAVFIRRDNLFTFRTTSGTPLTIVLISDKRQIDNCGFLPTHINYAIVCNGFRGDILDLVEKFRPDSIILSSDLNRRRHDRYIRELEDASVSYRSLRENPFSITLKRVE